MGFVFISFISSVATYFMIKKKLHYYDFEDEYEDVKVPEPKQEVFTVEGTDDTKEGPTRL